MTRLESWSMVESTMDDATVTKPQTLMKTQNDKRSNGEDHHAEEEECDVEAWDTLSKRFRQVQNVLDQNRKLIQQVNENHQSKIPDNLAKNVSLICEINGNISKVMSIYADLSVNFSNIVHQRRRISNSDDGKVESSES